MFQGKRARIAGPSPEPPPVPLIGAVPVPRMDNIAVHTARAWTALRVPMLPTLEACLRPDAPCGLAEQPFFNFPLRGEDLSPLFLAWERLPEGEREGALGKLRPTVPEHSLGAFPHDLPSVGRSVAHGARWQALPECSRVHTFAVPLTRSRLSPLGGAVEGSRCNAFDLHGQPGAGSQGGGQVFEAVPLRAADVQPCKVFQRGLK